MKGQGHNGHFCKNNVNVSAHYIENCSQNFHDWSWWEHDPWCLKVNEVKDKVAWATFVINYVYKQFLVNIWKTIDYKAWRHLHYTYS